MAIRTQHLGSSTLHAALAVLILSFTFSVATGCDSEKTPAPTPAAEPAKPDPAAEPAVEAAAAAAPAVVAAATPTVVAAANPAKVDPAAAPAVVAAAAAAPAVVAAAGTAPDPAKVDPAAVPAVAAAAAAVPAVVAAPVVAAEATDDLDLPASGAIVTNPKAGTPQAVIGAVIQASLDPDADKGWEQFKAQLHTREMVPNALKARRSLNYPASRRKAHLFVVENPDAPGVFSYKVSYIEKPGDQLKIFVHNAKASPTPCYLAKDPEQDNAWKVTTCSL